jgi:hypothetical protein
MSVLHYYSRKGCHLCEIMLEELLPLIRGRLEIEYRDINSDPDWRMKYRVRIPVVELDGQMISEYPLDYDAVRAVLARLPENGQ